ncbi:MAG: thermosome subunit alpha [Candidatus Altarchaeum sp.]|nr:thermosome subunit alpha [Candidatus Altarchaeum sp.]
MAGQMGQPVLILPEGAFRSTGRDAMKANISAAKFVGEVVRTTLGPKGMDKMLVDDLGDITITNDGANIVDNMKVEHPAAKMMVEIAKTQDKEVGDGTTTVIVLASSLLDQSEKLLNNGIHPTVIIRGYTMAAAQAQKILGKISRKITLKDKETLEKIATTAMTGKGSEAAKTELRNLCVTAVTKVAVLENENVKVYQDDIQIVKKIGKSMIESELIEGVIIEKETLNIEMPKTIKNAKIALLDAALEVKKTETDAKISIKDPSQMQKFLEQEENALKNMVDMVKKSGANVLFCQKGIDDVAQYYLAKEKILAVRRVKKSDMEKLSKATDAKVVSSIKEISSGDLGSAGVIEQVKIAGDELVLVKECKNPKAVALLLRGGTQHVVDELERAIKDAVGGVASAIETGKYVIGAGALETELSVQLDNYAKTVGGREQLAISAFAEALEIIPKTLAESAGMDAIDTIVSLKEKHAKGKEGIDFGVDVMNKKIANMYEQNVIEPLKIKTQAIASATEAVEMILRIDDVVASAKKSMPPMPPGGGYGGGMGGMGDMGGMGME